MARVTVSVGIPDDANFGRVASALRSNGMTVERMHDVIGVVVGTVDEDGLEALRGVDGVASVEVQRDIGTSGGGGRKGAFVRC